MTRKTAHSVKGFFPRPRLTTTYLLLIAMLSIFLSACKPSSDAATAAQRLGLPPEPTKAQPRLRTMKLWLGREELLAELALTPDQVQTGMMFRTNAPENEAMLFVFAVPHRASFWMKNTQVPLSAAYINPDGVILEIHDLHPHNTDSVFARSSNIQYVLETAQGWFQRHNVPVGTVVMTEKGTLKETFGRR